MVIFHGELLNNQRLSFHKPYLWHHPRQPSIFNAAAGGGRVAAAAGAAAGAGAAGGAAAGAAGGFALSTSCGRAKKEAWSSAEVE